MPFRHLSPSSPSPGRGNIHSFCPVLLATLLSVRVRQVSLKLLVMLKINHMYGGVNTDVCHQKLKIIDESYLSV